MGLLEKMFGKSKPKQPEEQPAELPAKEPERVYTERPITTKAEKKQRYDEYLRQGMKPSEALMRIEGEEAVQKERREERPKEGIITKAERYIRARPQEKREPKKRELTEKEAYEEELKLQKVRVGREKARIEAKERLKRIRQQQASGEQPRRKQPLEKYVQEQFTPTFTRPSVLQTSFRGVSAPRKIDITRSSLFPTIRAPTRKTTKKAHSKTKAKKQTLRKPRLFQKIGRY